MKNKLILTAGVVTPRVLLENKSTLTLGVPISADAANELHYARAA